MRRTVFALAGLVSVCVLNAAPALAFNAYYSSYSDSGSVYAAYSAPY